MIDYFEALSIIDNSNVNISTCKTRLTSSLSRISASSIKSIVAMPRFDNSAMDGYAVKAHETAHASKCEPVILTVSDHISAGDDVKVISGVDNSAISINTGAAIPSGYDAVVKKEDVMRYQKKASSSDVIELTTPVIIQENIRKQGEDFRVNDYLLKKNTAISCNTIMALAASGITEIDIYSKPTISVIATGRELSKNALDHSSKIFDSNSPYIISFLQQIGIEANFLGYVNDDAYKFENMLKKIPPASNNIIISTGAVSLGTKDFIPETLKMFGADILFHKVRIKPGKPILYARLVTGEHFFGLPGNPISVAVGLRIFVCRLIRKMQGLTMESPLKAISVTDIELKKNFSVFYKAYMYFNHAGKLVAQILPDQESFKIKSLLKANCWASLPSTENKTSGVNKIDVYPMTPIDCFNYYMEN